MSMRRIARHVPWRQCTQRHLHPSRPRIQNHSTQDNATELLEVLRPTSKSAVWTPSALNDISLKDTKNELLQTSFQLPKFEDVKKPVVAAPTPAGYNDNIYKEVKELAEQGKDPSRKQLTELFRLMRYDSPYGEMKEEALAIWREMRSRKIIPTKDGYAALLDIAAESGDILMQDEIVESLPEDKMPLTDVMIHHLLKGLINNHEIDRAIFLFRDLRARKVRPRVRSYNLMIAVCAENGEPEEAFRILVDLKETWGDDTISQRNWWKILEICARQGYLFGTLHCWQAVQNIPGAVIPEGICLDVLSTAARNGHPALATSVFDSLSALGIVFREYHFLPLIEAYARCGDIRQAFIVISVMRESCLVPPQTSHLRFLIKEIGKSTQTLDRAFFILQDIVQKEGKSIDIVAFNCLLKACIHLSDASRAISTYRDAETLKIQPNIETFNILLNAAQIVGHTDLAMYILSDLKAAQITPNADTYGHVIITFLRHPGAIYDQAFLYLEEMKASGYIPSSGIYSSFVKKCVYQNDDRALTLLEEMKNLGYTTKILERWVRNAMRVGAGSTVGIKVARMGDVRREEMEASREMFRVLKSGKGEDVVEQRHDDDDVNNILDQ